MISRDPQKIGEMSTGQHWRSCMATDGINFSYVPQDIEAGSLVAYVAHKDDPDARYPLMRAMIKPFTRDMHDEHGLVTGQDSVLVPAHVYGGSGGGNAHTRAGFEKTLHAFVCGHNQGKSGEYVMDSRLYPDGQVTTAGLYETWSGQEITAALLRYQESGLQEWEIELADAAAILGEPYVDDIKNTLESIKKKAAKSAACWMAKTLKSGCRACFTER